MIASIPFPDVSPALFSVDIPLWQFSLAGMDFSLGGFELALRWYALAYIAGILLASWIMRRALRRPSFGRKINLLSANRTWMTSSPG